MVYMYNEDEIFMRTCLPSQAHTYPKEKSLLSKQPLAFPGRSRKIQDSNKFKIFIMINLGSDQVYLLLTCI